MTDETDRLSTSRLAEMAGIERKKLFGLLKDNGWIAREDNHWKLTAQGEFHGGSYQYSEKFGEYIVWPAALLEHELLVNYQEDWLSATRIAEKNGLAPRTVNQFFSDMGWITRDQRGWMLTDAGRDIGGQQRDGKQGFFVLWPGAVLQHEDVVAGLGNITGKVRGKCLDGHEVSNAGEQQVDNWLYLNHIAHAIHRHLPGSDLVASFFLPERKIYIDYWGVDISSGSLTSKLDKEAWCQQHGLHLVSLGDDDLAKLDDVLRQHLLQHGLQLH